MIYFANKGYYYVPLGHILLNQLLKRNLCMANTTYIMHQWPMLVRYLRLLHRNVRFGSLYVWNACKAYLNL